jgi:7-carboxy-7-deazaguanine synthase
MPKPASYRVNEIFFSLQGEGMRAGTPNVFIRLSGCNLTCNKAEDGFDCDTEFVSGRAMSVEEVVEEARRVTRRAGNTADIGVILTGGEPALQLAPQGDPLIAALRDCFRPVAIETNGSYPIPEGITWSTCSPKVAEHAVKVERCDELKYVRGYGQGIPKPKAKANHYLISPAFDGGLLDPRALEWCIELVKENPEWRLSVQQHKLWRVR